VALAIAIVLGFQLLTPVDIRRLVPAAFEFLWRTILSREHGTSYRHVDGHGIDCLAGDAAYQIYHHQGASWPVVQGKFRDDLHAAARARAKGQFQFDEFVFISTFGFQDPAHRSWLERRKARAMPLRVTTWGEEHLCDQLARYPDLARQFGLGVTVVDDVGPEYWPVDLPSAAVTILERLLAAPEETLTLADLRSAAGLEDPATANDFTVLVRSLQELGFIRVINPSGEAMLLPEIRVIFQRAPASPIVVASARLLAAGKRYLARHRRGSADE